jgi:hypothetical protein
MSNLVRSALVVTAGVIVLGFEPSGLHAQQRVEPFPSTRDGGNTTHAPRKGEVATEQSCEQYDSITTAIKYQCLSPPPAPNEDTWTLVKTVDTTDGTLNLNTGNCDVEARVYTYKIALGKCEGKKVQEPKDGKQKTKWLILFEKLTGETAKKGD